MAYTPFHSDWKDAPDSSTPITAAALEYIEAGIVAAALAGDLAVAKTLLDAKGDIIAASAGDTPVRLAAGAADTVLGTDAGQTSGLIWKKVGNAMVASDAAISYSKLNLSGSVVNADIHSAAAIAYSKLNLSGSVVNADIAAGAAIAQSKIAGGWTTIVKAADEAVASSTALQNDNHFLFTATNGVMYEIEFLLIYASPNVGSTPGMKIAFGEDTTNTRGNMAVQFVSSDTPAVTQILTDQTTTATSGTNPIKRLVVAKGVHLGAGGTFRLLWAQGTSDADATTLYASSQMRYRTIA